MPQFGPEDRAVFEAVRWLQPGSTASYGDIARMVGKPGAARAVGGAVGRCPIGLAIPCHRVIAGDGSLGGYGVGSWGGRQAGLELGTDVSMIAHDDVFPYLNADNMYPTMSTTRSSIRQAGARIAELILQVLAGKPLAEVHELWPVELVLRESSQPVRE